MRALVIAVAVVALCGCDADDAAPAAAPPAAKAPPVRAQAAAAQKANDECRDNCEQTNIVAGGGDDALRACRARCDGRYGAAAAAHEVPSKITVGKPSHAPPLVKPIAR